MFPIIYLVIVVCGIVTNDDYDGDNLVDEEKT